MIIIFYTSQFDSFGKVSNFLRRCMTPLCQHLETLPFVQSFVDGEELLLLQETVNPWL